MSASERRKGNNSIEIVNNYRFQIKSRRNEKRYVKCCGYNNITCHVTGYILEDGSCHFRGVHQHPTIEHEIALEVFKDKLWLEVMTNESDGLRAMYDKCARESPGIASEITFTSIERSMARWRLQFRPQIPATLFQYGEILNSERWEKFRDYPGGRLTVRTIEVNATTTVCVFGDPIFLTSVPARVELYIDATFKVCPKNPKVAQFFTIMAQVDDAAVPIAWAHMSNKTAEAYRVILAHFRQELAPHIQPTVVHLDFERSEEIAVRQVYPETTLLHCFFHYVQAMFRQLKTKLGDVGMNRMQNWPLAQGVFRKLLALALLPAESILPSYEWLIENTPNDIREFYAEFFHYYQTWWLTRVRPERYSVYGHNTRTNNAIEAYHRVLHCDCGDHPGIWKFTAKIRDLQAKASIELNSLNRGNAIRRASGQRYVDYDLVLKHASKLYTEGRLSLPRFLACANHFLLAFHNRINITTIDQVNQFRTYPAHNIAVQPSPIGIQQLILQNDEAEELWIPILRDFAQYEDNIVILEDLNHSKCLRCHNSILNFISLPCEHWFACEACTELEVRRARPPGLFCVACGSPCAAFKIFPVS